MIKKLVIFNVYGWLFLVALSFTQGADQTEYSEPTSQPQTRGVWSGVKAVKTTAVWVVSSVWWGWWSTVAGVFRYIKRILPSRKVPKSPDVSVTPLVVVGGKPYNKEELNLEEKKVAPGTGGAPLPVSQPGSADDWQHVDRTGSGSPTSMMYFPDEEPDRRLE